MVDVRFGRGALTASEQAAVTEGFRVHNAGQGAPDYVKDRVKWLAVDEGNELKAALTADVVWDWMYIDELWVRPESRGTGLGKRLMLLAEEHATRRGLRGIWLWTQSWQAIGFYSRLGFQEFTRFDDFPQGHTRVGFRKQLDSRLGSDDDY